MKNTVGVIDMDTILANKEKYALEFSEGNQLLKTLLLKLWDNGIFTRGCCIGHEEEEEIFGSYIGIDLLNSDINKVLCFFDNIEKDNLYISSTSDFSNVGCSVHSFDKNDNHFFNNLINALEKTNSHNDTKLVSEYMKKIDIIKEYNDKLLNFRYTYENNNLVENICQTTNPIIIDKYKNMYPLINKINDFHVFDIQQKL